MMNMLNSHDPEPDNGYFHLLSEIGVGIVTQRFFFPFFSHDNGHIGFDFIWKDEVLDKEIFGVGIHHMACSTGLWLAGATKNVLDVFLFFSAAEALVFFHLHQHKYDFLNRCAFIALGVKPCMEQIEFVKLIYRIARVHTVFGNDLVGRIYDCKVGLWLTRKDCKFYLSEKHVIVEDCNLQNKYSKWLEVDRSKFSYSAFYRSYGGRSHVRTHKPPKLKYNSFLDYMVDKSVW